MNGEQNHVKSVPDLFTAGALMMELERAVFYPSSLKALKRIFNYVSEEEVQKAISELRKVYNLGKSQIHYD